MITAQFKILESTAQIEKKIAKAMQQALTKIVANSFKKIVPRVKRHVRFMITGQPEYNSLLGGKLQQELGVPSPVSRLEQILDIWINDIVLENKQVTVRGTTISGGFTINMIRRDWSDVLQSSAASYEYVNNNESVITEIEWLKWLLIEGDKTIVKDYIVSSNKRGSRTGLGIMVRKAGSRWRVPPEFSGTPRNNFVTRALEGIDKDILNIIKSTFEGEAKRI